MRSNFWGRENMDNFVWWKGVVEDRFDPLQCGRCKVRIFGWHTEDKEKMPTKELPWARPSIPLDSGRMNSVGPREGAWVWGFFGDGPHAQEPIIIGLIPGFPEREANPKIGFYDPRPDSLLTGHKVPREPEELQQHDDGSGNDIFEQEKKSRFPDAHFLPEPDTSRYARGYDGGNIDKTVIPWKIENIKIGQTDIPTGTHIPGTGTDVASPGTEWTERITKYNAVYPYNHVYFSEGGHIIEVDDTPNAERLHWYHRVGTFKEIDPLGAVIEKIVDSEYKIILEHSFKHVEASEQKTVDWFSKEYVNKDAKAGFNKDVTIGAGGDYNITTEGGKLNIYLNGDWNVYVDGSAYIEVEDNLVATVHKELHATVDKNAFVHIKEDLNGYVQGNANVRIDKDLNCDIGGDWNGRVEGNKTQIIQGDYKLFVGGNFEAFAAGKIQHAAAGNIENISAQSILGMALVQISDVAPLVIHTAGVEVANIAPLVSNTAMLTSCSGELLGITVDSRGDITPPGPPSPSASIIPIIDPAQVLASLGSAIADMAELLLLNSAAVLIQAMLESIMTDAEYYSELNIAEIFNNPNAPATSSADSLKGPSIFVDGPGGFLWKPLGDYSQKLTVLTPSSEGVSIYKAVPKANGKGYEKGNIIGSLRLDKSFADGRTIYRDTNYSGAWYEQHAPIICSVSGDKDYLIDQPAMRYD